mmetsp:Transcript_7955/g.18429  ORF Transcript_7955/g.18429 Transcript_7955/m.18429 type:complete len:276 (-) Transcript_7955:109-936(-)
MGGTASKGVKTGSGERDRLVLFGDSITQQSFSPDGGWGATLADVYQRRCDVLNRGYSGYNTRWALAMLRSGAGVGPDTSESSTRLVTVFFGANDASLVEENPKQHVPLAEYAQNLKDIVEILRQRLPSAKILLLTPPPVCHTQRLAWQKERYREQASGRLERTNEMAGQYAAAVEQVAQELGLPALNLWKLMQDVNVWPEFLTDGLHLSPKGNQFVANALREKISDVFPDLAIVPCKYTGQFGNSGSSCAGVATDCPWWEDVDVECPANSFSPAT